TSRARLTTRNPCRPKATRPSSTTQTTRVSAPRKNPANSAPTFAAAGSNGLSARRIPTPLFPQGHSRRLDRTVRHLNRTIHVSSTVQYGHALFYTPGGTNLQASGNSITQEKVWNNGPNSGATGGGVSSFFALPLYQEGLQVRKTSGGTQALAKR